MKYTLRLPTKEQYAFIEVSGEVDSIQETITAYEQSIRLINGGFGLEPKEWNAALDSLLSIGTIVNGTELYAQMSKEQQNVLQEIKKSFKRLKYDKIARETTGETVQD